MELPPNLAPNGSSPEFDSRSVPVALLGRHAIGPRNWAVLHVLAGRVTWFDLEHDDVATVIGAGGAHVIPPVTPHRIEPSSDARFRLDFFRECD